jgi:Short C-terminal domain/Phospholipase_D-nuclease N-terminal
LLATDYPFLDVLWTMLIFFAWVIWFWLLITIFSDLFRRHDIGGGKKTLWCIFVIITPFLGVFVYLIAENKGMTERNTKAMQKAQAQSEEYIRSVATQGDPAAQIAQAKQLLDSGAIDQAEFDALKKKALAAPA